MVTLTKLLEIRIVANKRSESFSRALIRLSEVCFPSSISLKSTGEKKAISEADTKPEAYNNKTANKIDGSYGRSRYGYTVK